jgi:hypothetical protein
MSVLLEMPEVRQRLSRLTVEEYHRLGEFNGKGRRTELMIVLCPDRRVEVYRQPENGRYRETRLYGPGDLLACASVPTVQIHVSELFGTAP